MYKSKQVKPWITRSGKLGGPGFLSKPSTVQYKLLDNCVKKYGYKSCLGSVIVLMRNQKIYKHYKTELMELKNYLKYKYGV
jgi:hypothetical protein